MGMVTNYIDLALSISELLILQGRTSLHLGFIKDANISHELNIYPLVGRD